MLTLALLLMLLSIAQALEGLQGFVVSDQAQAGDATCAVSDAPAPRWVAANAVGRLTGVVDEPGGEQLSYDALGRVVGWRRWWGERFQVPVSYAYDDDGNLEGVTVDRVVEVRTDHGPGGRVEAVEVDIRGVTTSIVSDVTYHPDGTWAELAYANGVTITRERDGLARTSSLAVSGSTDDVEYTYTYDANDNLETLSDLDGTDSFTYDALDRLLDVQYGDDGTEQEFTYDDAGNVTDLDGDYATFSGYTYTYNQEDGHTYDAVGNLTDDGSTSLTYDARGQVTSEVSSRFVIENTYDASGRRVQRDVTSARSLRTQTTYYVHDTRGRLLATYGTVGARGPPRLRSLYVYAGDLPVAVVRADRGNAVYWLHTDVLGSVRQNSDAAGSVGGTVEYLPYGSERARWGQLLAPDHAWAEHGGFDQNGVADFRARSFLEDLPVFVTPDRVDWGSADDPQSLNRFAYGRGNPVRYTDPSGEFLQLALVEAYLFVRATQLDVAAAYAAATMLGITTAVALDEGLSTGNWAPMQELSADVVTGHLIVSPMMSMKGAGGYAVKTPMKGAAGGVGPSASGGRLHAEAEAARDALAKELAAGKHPPATVVGGYSPSTRQVTAGASRGGGLGCAEGVCAEALGNPANIQFTTAVRPRTGGLVPVCPTCEATYGRGAFPDPATKYKTDAP